MQAYCVVYCSTMLAYGRKLQSLVSLHSMSDGSAECVLLEATKLTSQVTRNRNCHRENSYSHASHQICTMWQTDMAPSFVADFNQTTGKHTEGL